MFKKFYCHELFPETECCPDKERFCFMRNDPTQVGAVLRVEVYSCCKHAHEVNKLPIEFFIKHHVPYKEPIVKAEKKKKREEDDDWLW